MTLNQVYREGRSIIEKAGLSSPAFDAMCLLMPVFGISDRTALALHGADEVSRQDAESYLELCRQRTSRPLQYILGKWEFCGMELRCGEGVLVPREDTMALVQCASDRLKDKENPEIIDLCAGTGAVGLGICRLLNKGHCTSIELSNEAFPYLLSNIEAYGEGRLDPLRGDVLSKPDVGLGMVDAIVSNPPYIATAVLKSLDRDVQKEPEMALDGGEDGLKFYRAIIENWLHLLKPDGILAVEIGYDQKESVSKLFENAGMAQICAVRDLNENYRAIIGTKVS